MMFWGSEDVQFAIVHRLPFQECFYENWRPLNSIKETKQMGWSCRYLINVLNTHLFLCINPRVGRGGACLSINRIFISILWRPQEICPNSFWSRQICLGLWFFNWHKSYHWQRSTCKQITLFCVRQQSMILRWLIAEARTMRILGVRLTGNCCCKNIVQSCCCD